MQRVLPHKGKSADKAEVWSKKIIESALEITGTNQWSIITTRSTSCPSSKLLWQLAQIPFSPGCLPSTSPQVLSQSVAILDPLQSLVAWIQPVLWRKGFVSSGLTLLQMSSLAPFFWTWKISLLAQWSAFHLRSPPAKPKVYFVGKLK